MLYLRRMKLKHIRSNIWQVSALLDGGQGNSARIPTIVKFLMHEDPQGLQFLRAWAYSCAVPESDDWMFRSWLESVESEIRDLAGIGEP